MEQKYPHPLKEMEKKGDEIWSGEEDGAHHISLSRSERQGDMLTEQSEHYRTSG